MSARPRSAPDDLLARLREHRYRHAARRLPGTRLEWTIPSALADYPHALLDAIARLATPAIIGGANPTVRLEAEASGERWRVWWRQSLRQPVHVGVLDGAVRAFTTTAPATAASLGFALAAIGYTMQCDDQAIDGEWAALLLTAATEGVAALSSGRLYAIAEVVLGQLAFDGGMGDGPPRPWRLDHVQSPLDLPARGEALDVLARRRPESLPSDAPRDRFLEVVPTSLSRLPVGEERVLGDPDAFAAAAHEWKRRSRTLPTLVHGLPATLAIGVEALLGGLHVVVQHPAGHEAPLVGPVLARRIAGHQRGRRLGAESAAQRHARAEHGAADGANSGDGTDDGREDEVEVAVPDVRVAAAAARGWTLEFLEWTEDPLAGPSPEVVVLETHDTPARLFGQRGADGRWVDGPLRTAMGIEERGAPLHLVARGAVPAAVQPLLDWAAACEAGVTPVPPIPDVPPTMCGPDFRLILEVVAPPPELPPTAALAGGSGGLLRRMARLLGKGGREETLPHTAAVAFPVAPPAWRLPQALLLTPDEEDLATAATLDGERDDPEAAGATAHVRPDATPLGEVWMLSEPWWGRRFAVLALLLSREAAAAGAIARALDAQDLAVAERLAQRLTRGDVARDWCDAMQRALEALFVGIAGGGPWWCTFGASLVEAMVRAERLSAEARGTPTRGDREAPPRAPWHSFAEVRLTVDRLTQEIAPTIALELRDGWYGAEEEPFVLGSWVFGAPVCHVALHRLPATSAAEGFAWAVDVAAHERGHARWTQPTLLEEVQGADPDPSGPWGHVLAAVTNALEDTRIERLLDEQAPARVQPYRLRCARSLAPADAETLANAVPPAALAAWATTVGGRRGWALVTALYAGTQAYRAYGPAGLEQVRMAGLAYGLDDRHVSHLLGLVGQAAAARLRTDVVPALVREAMRLLREAVGVAPTPQTAGAPKRLLPPEPVPARDRAAPQLHRWPI